MQFDHLPAGNRDGPWWFSPRLPSGLRAAKGTVLWRALAVMGGLVVLQYGLGVATLLSVVAVPLATAHQAVAVLLLTAIIVTAHLDRRMA